MYEPTKGTTPSVNIQNEVFGAPNIETGKKID